MTRPETVKLLTMMKALYYRHNVIPTDKREYQAMILAWSIQLEDLDFEIVKKAVQKHNCENVFPPAISEIRSQALEIITPKSFKLPAAAAWGEVMNAISKFGMYQESAALASLSPITRQAVEAMGFNNLCISEDMMVDRAHFLKMYDSLQERERKQALLPPGITNFINALGGEKPILKLIEGGAV